MWGCLTVCLSVGYDLAVWLAQIITFVGEMKTAGREARGRDAKGDRVWGGVSPYPGGRAWEGGCAPVPRIFRQPDSVGTALSFTVEFFLSLFLPDDGSQHPRRGQPANVYQRFGHRCNYYQWPRYLVNPSPNFYRGSKSVIFGLIAQQRSTLSRCGLETEQDIFTIFKLGVRWLSDNVPTPHQILCRSLHAFNKSPMLRLEHPVKTDEKYVVNHQ